MSFLKTIIPLLIILGLLQAGVLMLPLLYWRFSSWLNIIERYLFGAVLFFIAFVLHPLIVIILTTFTVAPSLLSMRHELSSRMSTIYMALVPSSLASLSAASLSNTILSNFPLGNGDLVGKGRRNWLLTALGSYVGWKAIGILPFVVVVGVFFALRGGKEEVEAGKKDTGENIERRETGVALRRRRRTDVQVVG